MESKESHLAAVDIAVLGTALVYRKHQTGVHRTLTELLAQFSRRDDLRLEFLSAGRAPWLEFPSRIAFERHWRRQEWIFRARKARIPGSYSLLLALGSFAIFAKERGWIAEPMLASFLQLLGWGLRPVLADFSSKIYYSPAHALPSTPVGVKRCITLYDVIPVKFPEWYHESESFRKILRSIDTKNDIVVSISECSRRDWLDYSEADPGLCRVIPLGVANHFFPRADDAVELSRVRKKYGLERARFILTVGTLEPRKNLALLVEAFLGIRERAAFRDVVLLLAGPNGWKNEALFARLREHPEAAHGVRLAGFVPDEDLPALYSAAEVFVFPSLYEGFGLPVAEALKCGAVVLCGRHSSLFEVAGDAAEYTDVTHPDIMRESLENLMSDKARRKELKEKASRLHPFSWERAAESYFELFSAIKT